MARFMSRFGVCVLHMYTCRKPVVASLSGHALAGGAILALTADWRVLRDDALVGLNELKVGVPLPFGVTMILRDAIAGPRLEEVALFGRNYRGREAIDAGLVHEVAPAPDLDDVAVERLREMTSKDLRSFAVTKAYLRSRTVERIRAYEGQFLDEWLDCWFSPGTRARVEAIVADLTARKGA
jgi:enoyl-CoA hydratase